MADTIYTDAYREAHGDNGPTYRLFVNADSTVMVELWENGTVTVATRDHPSHTWGPPVTLTEQEVH